jgi:hypothetical protein
VHINIATYILSFECAVQKPVRLQNNNDNNKNELLGIVKHYRKDTEGRGAASLYSSVNES